MCQMRIDRSALELGNAELKETVVEGIKSTFPPGKCPSGCPITSLCTVFYAYIMSR